MNYCNKCRFYQKTVFTQPKCNRVSNYHVIKKKNVPFTLEESFRICKGYFFEHEKSDMCKTHDDLFSGDMTDEPPPSSGH